MTHRSIRDVLNDIDSYLGLPPAPASAAAGSKATQPAQAAERNTDVLHIMFDTRTNNFVGASIGGKLFSGAVGAHLTKDGASLLNRDGENLLGAKAGVPENRSQGAVSSQVARDIYDLFKGVEDDE